MWRVKQAQVSQYEKTSAELLLLRFFVVPPALFYLYMRQQERKPSIAKTLIFNSFLYNFVKT